MASLLTPFNFSSCSVKALTTTLCFKCEYYLIVLSLKDFLGGHLNLQIAKEHNRTWIQIDVSDELITDNVC